MTAIASQRILTRSFILIFLLHHCIGRRTVFLKTCLCITGLVFLRISFHICFVVIVLYMLDENYSREYISRHDEGDFSEAC